MGLYRARRHHGRNSRKQPRSRANECLRIRHRWGREYLLPRGSKIKGEYIKIGSWPVQFLPPGSPLEMEALDSAIQTQLDEVPTWVMTAEHLVAIAPKVGRPKDFNLNSAVQDV